jgi:hypothetical protein
VALAGVALAGMALAGVALAGMALAGIIEKLRHPSMLPHPRQCLDQWPGPGQPPVARR